MGTGRAERIVADVGGLGAALVDAVTGLATSAIAVRGRFVLAVPGGSVASGLLPLLAGAAIDWRRTDVVWVDERAVPPDDPESNFAGSRAWLAAAGVPAERVHRMAAESGDLDAAAAAYATTLRSLLPAAGGAPVLDLAILGVGPDGHVASLFPGHPALAATAAVVGVEDAPKPPPRRLTLTLPVLVASRLVVVAAFGAAKAAVMARALGEPGCELPVARVLALAGRSLVLLDPPAAAGLAR